MKLRCVSRYSSHLGTFEPGQVFDVADKIGGELQRSSPGSFELYVVPIVAEETPAPDLSAMSTETETNIKAPDRRARGGRRRKK